MALTISIDTRDLAGGRKIVVADVAFDSSYPTGGEDLTPGDIGLDSVQLVTGCIDGYVFEFDASNDALIAYSGGSEVTNTTDLSSVSGKLVFIGR